jgi:hypothetical protein
MTRPPHDARWAALPALLAAPLAVAGLLLGLVLVDFDAEAFRDPDTVLQLGEQAAGRLRASYLLVMLGSYLLLVPLALWYAAAHGDREDPRWRLATVAGLAYLGLGAAGSCILAAVWPDLIRQYEDGGDSDTLVIAFRTATRIAEDGLQGAAQNLAGAVWWGLLGQALLRAGRRGLGILTVLLAVASTLTTAGALLTVEALTLPGLTLTVLLVPVWAVWSGLHLLRTAAQSPRSGSNGRPAHYK